MLMVRLGEIAEIHSGQILSRIAVDTNVGADFLTCRVIVSKAISSEGMISEDEIPNEKIKNLPDAARMSKVGDIVIKLSTPFDCAIVTEEFADCIVPSFCAIIRCGQRIDREYLQATINSNYCKEQLRSKVVGSITSVLSISKLKEIEIPLPDWTQQKSIGADYRRMQERVAILKRIVELEKKRNDIVISGLVKYE